MGVEPDILISQRGIYKTARLQESYKMSSIQRSALSQDYSRTSSRLNRETTTPSSSRHNITPTSGAQHQAARTITYQRQDPAMDIQDDDSIHSTTTATNPNKMLITPCNDFFRYGVWLRNQFPHIITSTGSFFVHSCLKIRSKDDIYIFMEYQPEDWQSHLPKSYHI